MGYPNNYTYFGGVQLINRGKRYVKMNEAEARDLKSAKIQDNIDKYQKVVGEINRQVEVLNTELDHKLKEIKDEYTKKKGTIRILGKYQENSIALRKAERIAVDNWNRQVERGRKLEADKKFT